jgi:hypothetical protein
VSRGINRHVFSNSGSCKTRSADGAESGKFLILTLYFNQQVYKPGCPLDDAALLRRSKRFVEMFSVAVSIFESIQKVRELNV